MIGPVINQQLSIHPQPHAIITAGGESERARGRYLQLTLPANGEKIGP